MFEIAKLRAVEFAEGNPVRANEVEDFADLWPLHAMRDIDLLDSLARFFVAQQFERGAASGGVVVWLRHGSRLMMATVPMGQRILADNLLLHRRKGDDGRNGVENRRRETLRNSSRYHQPGTTA